MGGFLGAVSLLTRVPAQSGKGSARAVPWLPVVGALIGGLCAAVYAGARLALPALASATLAVGAGILLTGALHEDGLADTADAFGAGVDRNATLAILKDPHHGSYGMLAIAIGVVARIAAVAGVGPAAAAAALPAAHAVARATSPLLMRVFPAATEDGLGGTYAKGVTGRATVLGVTAGAAAALGLLGGWGVVAIAVTVIVAAATGALAMRKIGGITGDVLGAAEQLAEVGVLLLALATARSIPWWRG